MGVGNVEKLFSGIAQTAHNSAKAHIQRLSADMTQRLEFWSTIKALWAIFFRDWFQKTPADQVSFKSDKCMNECVGHLFTLREYLLWQGAKPLAK
jgi:hypothetical protein